MEIGSFLTAGDARRAGNTLRRLGAHDIAPWALTGGLAIELHIAGRGGAAIVRDLHDIDFVTEGFGFIPRTLGGELLLRHVHPDDPPGKTILQGVERGTGVRVDVFRAYGGEMERAARMEIDGASLRVISAEDIAARHARLCWDLMEGKRVAPKYARDFLRLMEVVSVEDVEGVWLEHRKAQCSEGFRGAVVWLRGVIAARGDLLVAPVYSTDVDEVCGRYRATDGFPLADAGVILSILGYC
jgi:hypothetical protein